MFIIFNVYYNIMNLAKIGGGAQKSIWTGIAP